MKKFFLFNVFSKMKDSFEKKKGKKTGNYS